MVMLLSLSAHQPRSSGAAEAFRQGRPLQNATVLSRLVNARLQKRGSEAGALINIWWEGRLKYQGSA
jgi:hypothetical protein